MIERTELQKIIGYIYQAEERRRNVIKEKESQGEVKIEIAEELKNSKNIDYEDLYKKVEAIRESLEKGTYEVSSEKILKGLEKYLF